MARVAPKKGIQLHQPCLRFDRLFRAWIAQTVRMHASAAQFRSLANNVLQLCAATANEGIHLRAICTDRAGRKPRALRLTTSRKRILRGLTTGQSGREAARRRPRANKPSYAARGGVTLDPRLPCADRFDLLQPACVDVKPPSADHLRQAQIPTVRRLGPHHSFARSHAHSPSRHALFGFDAHDGLRRSVPITHLA